MTGRKTVMADFPSESVIKQLEELRAKLHQTVDDAIQESSEQLETTSRLVPNQSPLGMARSIDDVGAIHDLASGGYSTAALYGDY